MSIETAAVGRAQVAPILRATAAAALSIAVLGLGAAAAIADAVLTLSSGPGHAEVLELSLDELVALQQVKIRTGNEFVDGEVSFSGPLVRDVVDRLALGKAEVLRFIASNDYSVEIPTTDFHRFNVILAMEIDGKRLSRRDKGPLWLMYPISDHTELTDPVYIHRLIWQVIRIEAI